MAEVENSKIDQELKEMKELNIKRRAKLRKAKKEKAKEKKRKDKTGKEREAESKNKMRTHGITSTSMDQEQSQRRYK